MLFYFYDLSARWTAPHAIAYWSSFILWRSYPHQLRIALMPYRNIISSNKKIGLGTTLDLMPWCSQRRELGPQKLFPKGSVHHFVMSKVAGIHQQAKLVDEFKMFSKSSIGQSKSWSIQWTKVYWIHQRRSHSIRHRIWGKMTEIPSLSHDWATNFGKCSA